MHQTDDAPHVPVERIDFDVERFVNDVGDDVVESVAVEAATAYLPRRARPAHDPDQQVQAVEEPVDAQALYGQAGIVGNLPALANLRGLRGGERQFSDPASIVGNK